MICKHENLLSIAEFAREFPSFPPAQMYYLIRQRHENGLASVVTKISGLWVVDVDGFFRWIDRQRTQRTER